jgi:hypothetical protein
MRHWQLFGVAAVALAFAGPAWAGDRATGADEMRHPVDNTGRNAHDADGDTMTSGDQGSSKNDVEITRRIRQAIVQDKKLSTNAHNVKIVTAGGVVTLRGPVANAEERASVAAKAQEVAGVGHVDNQLEVSQH